MDKRKVKTWETLSCVSHAFGGRSKSHTIMMLEDAGIVCDGRNGYTPYVGHYAVRVPASQLKKAKKVLRSW